MSSPIVGNLLGIRGLNREQILTFLDTADTFREVSEREIKKVPTLRGRTVVNLFLEASTRTRTSFEIAAKRLSADAVNIGAKDSSVSKGESLLDTAYTIQAMNPEILVIRHAESGAPHFLAKYLKNTAIINAGDGLHEHPTQALLDALTIRQALGRIDKLKIVFIGDMLRGRVARSNIYLHRALGNTIRAVAPPALVPKELENMGVEVYYNLEEAIKDADVIYSLRLKFEYQADAYFPNTDEYTKQFLIKENDLARLAPQSIVLAPGPFYRGIDMTSEIIDGPRSQISKQVTNGVAVRMAAIYLLATQNQVERDSGGADE